jgi:hypothetical protein
MIREVYFPRSFEPMDTRKVSNVIPLVTHLNDVLSMRGRRNSADDSIASE